ncbi:alcohol dehydrogenase [Porphyromonas crevioricanis]|uniref:Alcohol dehydrogenase n=2 Tax=Porphyromonas crevioricanis TaxID=393921 RepID=A0A0A2FMF2_9PORP|nr:iron-containing alcohol dehydrogenase [Porphyromonas crevioricanis]KGN91307.1 alcohol dehydrogenase [Porphyromonas crevioricanis]KGN95398.1 alcohol dehydrogenase [Porphyromonas crevioricanis]SKA00773.1 NADP-dependent alcohol dehydrogenase [Porphyromonas crevioricanis]SQH72956.1 Alcohol dehydrogenase YqhD [Porphyromonas crevioricanis]GAD05804.1 iron-containing alcohol dehydrogenase [Porphyromonas crevioricanis JCM 15906]
MRNFEYYCPTRLVFGEGRIAKLPDLIPSGCRSLMIVFGGGSVRKNGVYEQVKAAIGNIPHTEFWGIEPNPCVETIRRAVEQGKRASVDFVLAVGGGSVIDATKLIVAALCTDMDAWEIVLSKKAEQTKPFGTVLTVPATGSEMNSGAVISRADTKEKFAFSSAHPVFSILDPKVTYSLSSHQVACGLADAFVHVIEQYLTLCGESRVMDRFAEGVLSTVIEIAPSLVKRHDDYDLMCDYMVSATAALNGMIAWGVTQDWATHMIGHEITALSGLTHGASLVIVLPAMMRVLREQKRQKLLQYAERVWNLHVGTEDERIDRAIELTEDFFCSLGLPTRLEDAGIGREIEDEVVRRFRDRSVSFGEGRNVDADCCRVIFDCCRSSRAKK